MFQRWIDDFKDSTAIALRLTSPHQILVAGGFVAAGCGRRHAELLISTVARITTATSIFVPFFIGFFCAGRLGYLGGINVLPRHAIFFAGPLVKIDQLAALRTKRPPRIALPFYRSATSWTFAHRPKVKRKKRNVKAQSRMPLGRAPSISGEGG